MLTCTSNHLQRRQELEFLISVIMTQTMLRAMLVSTGMGRGGGRETCGVVEEGGGGGLVEGWELGSELAASAFDEERR